MIQGVQQDNDVSDNKIDDSRMMVMEVSIIKLIIPGNWIGSDRKDIVII